ncbi:MAG TPA: MFS transporter [Gaiellales bacterium]|nr:MFS transporter [Gaiellales bacterium]
MNSEVALGPALVRRNTILLAATLTCLSGMLQLVVAVSTITLVLVTGVESILGLGPAVFLASSAVAALPAGRAMDRWARVPVVAFGCVLGMVGCVIAAAGAGLESAPLVLLGFVMIGGSSGTVLLVRAAAADLYPPERRARGISYVLFGSLFGAALGPLVFRPLLAGRHLDSSDLVLPYLAAGAIMTIGLCIILQVRPDPKVFAASTARAHPDHVAGAPAPSLSEVLARPGTIPAVIAAVTSFAVMVSVMNLTGYVVVGHGHAEEDIFTVISFHIIGMYSLVLVIGDMIDRIGRMPALVGGLVVMAVSALGLGWHSSVLWTSFCLFGLGLGWNVSYVAASAHLSDVAAPSERGRLIGFTDLLSGFTGAALALAGGAAYSAFGVLAIALGATLIAVAPIPLMLARREQPAVA